MKKILAAIAACAMSAAMLGMTVCAEGIEGQEEELDEGNTSTEEIIDETPEVDEIPAVDETPAVETPSVPSPGTGNAPIALAVIPVALAAAAIVAKKAK